MEKQRANILLAAVLSTLAELTWSPESALYMGLGVTLDDWYILKGLLTSSGMVTEANYAVTITDTGRALAAKIDGTRKAAK